MFSGTTMFWLLGISAFQVCGGVGIGWWLRSSRKSSSPTGDALVRRMADALVRVQSAAGEMIRNSAEHVGRIESVGKQLDAAFDADVEQLQQVLLNGVSQILSSNQRLQSQLNDVESKLEDQARQIDAQLAEARIDSLTGTANRRAFDEELARRTAEWRRRHTPMSLMLIDVDHFKRVNDRYGHPTGDAVLRQIARVIQSTMREMDFTARFGGEEFAVVFPATGLADARRAAQRLLAAVAAHPLECNGETLSVTVSVGLAEVQLDDDEASLVRRTDEALYLSKSAGRNCGHYHDGAEFLLLESPRLVEKLARTDEASAVAATPGEAPSPAAAAVDAPPRDRLTGLPTAQPFSTELRDRVRQARIDGRPPSLILFDVDRLERINRLHGRATGDRLLQRAADVLRAAAREGDFVARYHDGQFALVLAATGVEETARTAEEIRRRMQSIGDGGERGAVAVTVSCGVARADKQDRSVALVMRASTALAAAQASGGDAVFVHDGRTVEPADAFVAG